MGGQDTIAVVEMIAQRATVLGASAAEAGSRIEGDLAAEGRLEWDPVVEARLE
jgi:hypothetical protein